MRRGYEGEGANKGSPLDAPRREEQVQRAGAAQFTTGANREIWGKPPPGTFPANTSQESGVFGGG